MLILVLLVKRFFRNKPEQLEQTYRALEQLHHTTTQRCP